MDEPIEFAKGCAERGLCPRCLNMGEQNDNDIDLFGVCLNCGYSNPHNATGESRAIARTLDPIVGNLDSGETL